MVNSIIAHQIRAVDGQISSIIDDYNRQAASSMKQVIDRVEVVTKNALVSNGIDTNMVIELRACHNVTHTRVAKLQQKVKKPRQIREHDVLKQNEEIRKKDKVIAMLEAKNTKLKSDKTTLEICVSRLLETGEQLEVDLKEAQQITGAKAYACHLFA